MFESSDFSSGAIHVVERLQDRGFDAYVVGGAVRDLLLGKKPKDFDVATNATPEQIKRCFRSARIIGRRFQIVHVRSGRDIIEVTTFRGHHDTEGSDPAAQASQSGRLLRDNVYGSLDDDARRRDLTINALYYDTTAHALIDKMNGQADVTARVIRIIGTPADRYREDPVRMLRVLRFAARLKFEIEPNTRNAIAETGILLRDIPSARLFDEWLKLFMNGFSAPAFALLREHDLLKHLMGDGINVANHASAARQLQHQAMTDTDHRVAEDRPVTPAFLLAALLWPAAERRAGELMARGESALQAMHIAGQQIVQETCQHLAIPKRFSFAMRDIWDLQPRLERRPPKKIKDLLAHRWFRAAFDLRLLREGSSEVNDECSAFWNAQQLQYPELVGSKRGRHESESRRRSRPRRRKPAS